MNVRGIRNKNPMNVVKGSNWRGLRPIQTDGKFCQFTDMKWGLRAGIYILRRYVQTYHLNTIGRMILRWAPPSDGNLTPIYIKRVMDAVKVATGTESYQFDEEDFLLDDDKASPALVAMVKTICLIESGYRVSEKEIIEAIKLL